MKIVALEVENVKYLKMVTIKPDGSLVVVGGDNAAGKSCVLDSIWYALGGTRAVPGKPIRAGQKKARIVLDLGDIVVTRTFTKKGTNLTVKNKKGVTFASPQAMLDKLVGALTFDPLEFSKMDARKQSEVLKQLVGLDFDKMNTSYNKLFDERAIVNRRGKELAANLGSMIHHDDVPDTEVSVQELTGKYAEAVEHNSKVETTLRELDAESDELAELENRVAGLKKSIKDRQKALNDMEEIDVKAIRSEIDKAGITNNKVRENRIYTAADYDLGKLREESKSLSNQLTEIVTKKEKSLAKARFPIEGLAIDDDGVTFEDIPFIQCSSAQRIKVSVAIGLAMNPKLRILLIREGSLLDSKSLDMVAKMADDADAQVWVERVSNGSECSIIMEDGSVKEPAVASV